MRTNKPWLLIGHIVVIIGLSAGLFAQGTFTLEQVLRAPYPMHLVSAKSANRIAWVYYSEGKTNVWSAAAPDFEPKNLTCYVKDDVFEIPDIQITDDGSIVVYVRGGNPNCQGWVTNPTSNPDGLEQVIWAIKSSGGKPWKVALGNNPILSPDGKWILFVKEDQIYIVSLKKSGWFSSPPDPEQLFKAAGRNGSPRWSPDSKRVAFVSEREDHSFIGVFDREKRKITWMTPSVDRDNSPVWSPDGKKIVFFRRPGVQSGALFSEIAIWIADAETGQGQELWRSPSKEEPKYYAISNLRLTGNNRILFTAERDNWNHVFSLPLSGGEVIDLTPGEGSVEHLSLSSDGKILYFSDNVADIHGRHIWKVPTAGGNAVQLIQGATIGAYPAVLSSGGNVAFLYSTATYPTSIALVPTEGGKTEVIAPKELPVDFPLHDLVVPELVIVKADDGLEIPCQLFLPKDAKPGDSRPGIVYTHGGPGHQALMGWHYKHYLYDAYGMNQYFANHGYVVISINYRRGSGYGRSFRLAENTGGKGAAEYQDVIAGARYLQARLEVDPDRIGLWGLSYGGLLTALGLARNSDLFKAGVDLAGLHDWSRYGGGQASLPASMRKLAFESSAVASVNKWTSPVLFIHGDDDRNVPFSQTNDLVQKLRAKGDVHIELIVYPDEPHVFLLYEHTINAYKATFEFLDRFLRK